MSVTIGQNRPSVTVNALGGVTVRRESSKAVLTQSPRVVVQQRRMVVTILGGKQGIAGPPGSGGEVESYVAAASLGGQRAVGLDASGELVYADSSLGIPAIGVIRDAVTVGATAEVRRMGKVNGFTSLSPSDVYFLSTTGLLSLSAPSSGMIQPIGVAASATELSVEVDYPTFL